MRRSFLAPRHWLALLCSAAALCAASGALADPPDRVARLTQIEGTVTFSPSGEDEWAAAEPNRPLTTGDRLWSDAASHAELGIGTASARLGAGTSVQVLNLDDRIGQFQLAQGTFNLRVRSIAGDQFYEIDTPTLAFSIRQDGDYRIDVDPSGNTTIVSVRAGRGEAWGEGTSYVIDAGQQYTFTGPDMQYQYTALPPPDEFDRWCLERDRHEDSVAARHYVSPEVIGYSDLDQYGTWRSVEGYGNVWVPTQVVAGWAPYHYGRWAWIEPWGWTWIDDAPWGFAPFHYGRWTFLSSHWCWVPGPVAAQAVYAPALVAFVGGVGGATLSLSVGGPGVAWFPLGVGEVYRPSYVVSRNYFTNINVTNTVINKTYVTNVYNNTNVNITYRNREVAGAVTAVPATAFASGERVDRHAVALQRDVIAREQVTNVAAVAPSRASVIAAGAVAAGAAAAAAAHHPPAAALDRQVVARTAPPPRTPSFAARQSFLSAQPGRPLDADKMKAARSEHPAEAPKVRVVSPQGFPRTPERAAAKSGPAPSTPAAPEARAATERRQAPASNVAQPPAAAQERMRERAPQNAGVKGQPERAQGQEQLRTQQDQAKARAQQERAQEQQRAQQEKAQQERAQQERGQQQRAEQQRAEQQRAEQQRAQQEKAQQERAQQQRGEQQRAQQEKAQQQRAEQQRAQQERSQQQRAQQEQAQQQRAQQERAQQQRSQQERTQQQRAQQQQAQQQKAQQERAQQQKMQQEQAQAGRAQQQEHAQQERAQQQRAEQQRREDGKGKSQAEKEKERQGQ
jgi:hypothetical protein